MNTQKKKSRGRFISVIDVRILRYLYKKKTWKSVYEIVKGTKYLTRKGIREISYDTIKAHCKKLASQNLIHKWKNPHPKQIPKVKYGYDFTKTQRIRDLIAAQKQLNKARKADLQR